MSCSQFANGYFTLPKGEYNKVLKAFYDFIFKTLEQEIVSYNQMVDELLLANKGKRNLNWKELWENQLYSIPPYEKNIRLEKVLTLNNMSYGLFIDKPKKINSAYIKKNLQTFLKNSKSSETNTFGQLHYENATISFSKHNCRLSLYISEGNRSVDHFTNSIVFKELTNILNNVKWTRNTGGEILMNDEYNIEAMGGGYVFMQYPKSVKPKH